MSKKIYLLKKNYVSKETLNRQVKKIIDNTEADRAQALNLFNDITSRLGTAESNLVYAELAKTAIPVLKQVQDVNKTLLDAMNLIRSFIEKTTPKKKGDSNPLDLFEGLSKLTRSENGEETED
jgi:hypothetical protein